MYIKEIRLNGFKSFADKTILSLNSSFTGIVGPNGSGKSNIVDAVKWVLGEQSIKSLRGENNMQDVIFSGSASRNQSNHASVTIVFDNADRVLNIDYNEVEIKRIVYRTGENEYYINQEKCRLKDITNLLLDSSAAKESFNIVPQKKVDDILSEKPEDRRVIFEDASGVLKYKKRKEESLRKLSSTHDNISRVDMIINEISDGLENKELAAKKAREYKEAITELESVEVALIVKDITTFSTLLEEKTIKKESLESELTSLNTNSTSESTEVEKLKTSLLKIDESINKTSQSLFEINETLTELSNKKTLMSERNKYDKESNEIKNNLISLKDKEGLLSNNIKSVCLDVQNINEFKNNLNDKYTEYANDLTKKEATLSSLNEKYNYKLKNKNEISNRIDIIDNNISSLSKIPYSVKAIIDNPTLRGIKGIIASVIDTSSEYGIMLDVALGASSNNIITEDESCAKEAIEYLKSHNKGRATFFPLNVIKPKSIDPETLRMVSNIIGFVGVASDLVTYENTYYNIVMNQLGNILVATNVNTAIQISKKINHKYRVVSLDGEIIHVGGSLTGGSFKQSNSYFSDKNELDKLNTLLKTTKEEIVSLENEIQIVNEELHLIKDKIYNINIEIVKYNESISSKNITIEELTKQKNLITEEINTLESSNKDIDKELNKVIDDYYKKEQEKIELERNLELYKKEKLDVNSNIVELESMIKKMNSKNSSLVSNINTLEIDITKLNIALDNLLNRLSEDYSLGYEKASKEYNLEIDENIAREKVSTLRRKIKSLGEVNLGSIEEYERISTRVNFLNRQKDDLLKSENDLLEIINQMDDIMKDKFIETFEIINTEFNKIFKTLFKGGQASLELTNPDDVLNTGIDIIAIPAGKTKKPLSLLSGGERTLTAISILFAIMNIKKVPFVILDEVESDLDENNASTFGDYLKNYKNKTQLLVITHKKNTMECLDLLYGVTMQESGVSKLVSVKLED